MKWFSLCFMFILRNNFKILIKTNHKKTDSWRLEELRMERLRASISQPWMRSPRRPSDKGSAPAALSSFSSTSTSISSLGFRLYLTWPSLCFSSFGLFSVMRERDLGLGFRSERAVWLGPEPSDSGWADYKSLIISMDDFFFFWLLKYSFIVIILALSFISKIWKFIFYSI